MSLIFAHRGWSGRYPENTVLAFEKALEAGADGIELDVQLSKDGEVMVFHDESLERVTGYAGNIRDLTRAELEKLNVTAGFGGQYGENGIPTLRAYCRLVKDTCVQTNIEIKSNHWYYPQLEEKTVAVVREFGLADRVMFSSFNHVSVMRCRRLAPEIPAGLLWKGPILGNAAQFCHDSDLAFFNADGRYLTDEIAASLTALQIRQLPWATDDPELLRREQDWGVYGVLTNDPDCLLPR